MIGGACPPLGFCISGVRDDVDVVPALLANPHEGSYHDKKFGKRPKVTMTRDWSVEIPKGRPVVVIGNVIASGATWEAAQSVLLDADLVTLVDASRDARKEVADADIKNLADFMRHPEPPMSMDAFKEKFGSRNIDNGDPRVMFRRGANAVTPAEDAAYMDAVKRPDANERTTHLAPNGKRSNLTNALYHLVRTKRFKDWFGDWERYVLGSATESDCKAVIKNWRNTRKSQRHGK